MNRLSTHVLIIALAAHLWMTPSVLHAQAGKSGLSFLKLGISGRGVSMGDAMSASVNGAAATYYNPAGIFGSENSTRTQILLMHREWIQDVRSEFLGASVQLNDESAFGFSVNTTTVADIQIRTRPGTSEGSFSSRDYSVGATYARSFSHHLSIGITGKFLFEKIFIDEASGFGLDLGAQYKTPIDNLRLGLAIANLGSVNELRNEKIKLPSLLRFGPAYSFDMESMTSRVIVGTDLLYVFPEKKSYINLGGELIFDSVVAARVGYQFGSNARGLATGVGVQYGMFAMDYAFVPLSSDLGSGHTFSLELNF